VCRCAMFAIVDLGNPDQMAIAELLTEIGGRP
jgi:hypothetical protein